MWIKLYAAHWYFYYNGRFKGLDNYFVWSLFAGKFFDPFHNNNLVLCDKKVFYNFNVM